MKATGRGFSQPLDAFDVTLAPGAAAALLHIDGDDASRWSMSDIDAGEHYAGALVIEGSISTIQFWQFSA